MQSRLLPAERAWFEFGVCHRSLFAESGIHGPISSNTRATSSWPRLYAFLSSRAMPVLISQAAAKFSSLVFSANDAAISAALNFFIALSFRSCVRVNPAHDLCCGSLTCTGRSVIAAGRSQTCWVIQSYAPASLRTRLACFRLHSARLFARQPPHVLLPKLLIAPPQVSPRRDVGEHIMPVVMPATHGLACDSRPV